MDKEILCVLEMIRVKYGTEKPNALLNLGVAGIMGNCLVFTLSGSPKPINEYCTEIFTVLNHTMFMMAGIDGH